LQHPPIHVSSFNLIQACRCDVPLNHKDRNPHGTGDG
jgi:hypothetical protein